MEKLDSTLINNNETNNEDNRASYPNFVKEFQNASVKINISWNKEREKILKEDKNKIKIILKEINQIDFKVYIL